MKKVAILTLNGYINYENRLQNYALQEVLKTFGFDVETIINETKFNSKSLEKDTKKSKYRRILKLRPVIIMKKLQIRAEKYLFKDNLDRLRIEKFKLFSNNYILETDYCIS